MEILGILLSVPAAFVASTIYILLLNNFVARMETLRRAMLLVSAAVLIAFALEVLVLLILGTVRSRTVFGPGFYVIHVILFFFGTPALANVLVLRHRPGYLARWYTAVPLCTAFAFVLVLMQYGVSEALHGIDGQGGPFGK